MAHRWTVVISAALLLALVSPGVLGQDGGDELPSDDITQRVDEEFEKDKPVFEAAFASASTLLGCDNAVLQRSDDTSVSADGTAYGCPVADPAVSKVAAAVSYVSRPIPCSYAPLYFYSNGDNEHWVYADGTLLGHANYWPTTLTVVVPSPTQVIAVKVVDYGGVGGLLGSFSDGSVTDGSWRCTRSYYDGWNAPGYDDSFWPATTASKPNGDLSWGGLIGGVSSSAWWIWSGGYPTTNQPVTVYCRKRINYCVPQSTNICNSVGQSVVPSVIRCDGRLVKVVQQPNQGLFQYCDVVKCLASGCKCDQCETSYVQCQLLVYWNFGPFWKYRICRIPVPGCCNAKCLSYP